MAHSVKPEKPEESKISVSGTHVREAVGHCLRTLDGIADSCLEDRAGDLEWTGRETLEHLADDLLTYALRFGLAHPMDVERVPLRLTRDRAGGPANVIFGDKAAGADGLLTMVEACGGLLAAVLDSTAPDVLAPHVFGASDPEGFAAMGVVETLVHTYDVAQGAGRDGQPPEELSSLALLRLFPDVRVTGSAGSTLLWATGRTGTPERPRRTSWRWYGAPATAPSDTP
ncbi:maleylpyruvate isomerase N-terminal domain-containing protein [Streptomyces sp. NPDC046939]|uniref:maleylpyruvate isomerase N-terminal domain-containing protein n=1 Tax=Streptomyces sp. NPDC046939 TaxID=3155376 RepID=UPI0033D0B4B4